MADNPQVSWTARLRDPRFRTIFFFGMASGLPSSLVFATLSIWLREEGVSRTSIGLIGAAATPYAINFLWAPFVDRFRLGRLQIALGQRRSWIFACQALLIPAVVAMGLQNPQSGAVVLGLCALAVSTLSATQDVAIDAYRIEILEPHEYGAGAALARRAASGDVAAAAVMAGLAEAFGAPGVDGEVDITMLALHLCVSATPELGAGKAVEVARWLTDPEAEREAKRAAERAERAAAREARRAKAVAEGRTTDLEDSFNERTDAEETEAPLPPMDYKEKRAAWCAAAGPGAMSAAAVQTLRKKDLEGKDVDIPAMAVASGVGGAAPLLGIATRKWFNRYGFKDCHAVVMM